ncbi:MAG: thiamine pyrophosphate-dependent dehydrogenase E1 component subunit alpha [Acidobacteriaceae bacterium]
MTAKELTRKDNMSHLEVFNDPMACREAYRLMLLIRRFEERVIQLVNTNEIAGTTHEYIGEEAIAVGVCSMLDRADVIASTHRGHGHIIAKGGDVKRMMAELFGRSTGYNRGKGGSMHIADLALGIYGANGIVAAGVPIAAGAAWAAKIRKTNQVAVAFFGDGGANQGVLHETMNIAGAWQLPMIFVCENNQYAVTTPSIQSTAGPGISHRAAGYGFPGILVNGMDVENVMSEVFVAVERARSGQGPTLLECKTYRYQGHFTAEHALKLTYRLQEEIDRWRAEDPLLLWAAKLEERGILTAAECIDIDNQIKELIEEAVSYARASEWPDAEEAFADMYVTCYPGLPARGFEWNAN